MALLAEDLEIYGWSLFVALPFALGLVGALLHARSRRQTLRACMAVGLGATAMTGAGLMAVSLESAICIAMASPLAASLSLLGSAVGYALQRQRVGPGISLHAMGAIVAVLPLLGVAEKRSEPAPAVWPVTTSVVVDAPPAVVWRHVLQFPDLPPPEALIFRAGVAYPVGGGDRRSRRGGDPPLPVLDRGLR